MRRKSKGISPLVAVIMLIAFTMIVAGILAGWATRFATEQRSMLEKCVRAQFKISYASYNEAAGNITLRVYNSGEVPLRGFQAQIVYTEKTMMPTTWRIDATSSANSYDEYTHNLSSSLKDVVDYVEIRSIECGGAYDMIMGYSIGGIGPD